MIKIKTILIVLISCLTSLTVISSTDITVIKAPGATGAPAFSPKSTVNSMSKAINYPSLAKCNNNAYYANNTVSSTLPLTPLQTIDMICPVGWVFSGLSMTFERAGFQIADIVTLNTGPVPVGAYDEISNITSMRVICCKKQ